MRRWLYGALTAVVIGTAAPVVAAECHSPGSWIAPASGAVAPAQQVLAGLAARRVVLLGESHDSANDHRWQLHTLAALHSRHADLRIGLEMLPRAAQPALDRWVAGEISARALLEAVDWSGAWGFDPALSLPILHFARLNRIPLLALNVPRELVARVAEEGWAAIPEDHRAGLGDPAPAPAPYREMLADVFLAKQRMHDAAAVERAALADDPGFRRFVEAQLTWDRAMAEVIAETVAGTSPPPLVVALVGRVHAEYGHGIAHQLAALGVADTAVAVTVAEACEELPPGIADWVFVTGGDAGERGPPPPRLGVMIAAAADGVAVRQVLADSVAAAAGLAEGDVITFAAGVAVRATGELIAIVGRQAPGTWLPLEVRRDGSLLSLVAKFPAAP